MTTIYDRLQVNTAALGNNIIEFSYTTNNTMNTYPRMIPEWQETDIGNNDTSGYTYNPVANVLNYIYVTANNIYADANLVANLVSISTAAETLMYNTTQFLNHTNRLSNVTQPNGDTAQLPHYSSAIGTGKMMMQLTNKSDNVQNNSPILGSFSSIFTKSNLQNYLITLQSDKQTVNNSIRTGGPFGNTYFSTLTPAQVASITGDIIAVSNFMNSRRTSDETYYTTSVAIVTQMKDVKPFTKLGQSEKYLLNNFIGTEKLKSRIN
jgi:hypothetical protein